MTRPRPERDPMPGEVGLSDWPEPVRAALRAKLASPEAMEARRRAEARSGYVPARPPDPARDYVATTTFWTDRDVVHEGDRLAGSHPIVRAFPDHFVLAEEEPVGAEQTVGGPPRETDARAAVDLPARRRPGPDPDKMVSADAVRAERTRRMASDEPHGYDALARHFGVAVSTIRRRLGRL
jgi:hypothetical protein